MAVSRTVLFPTAVTTTLSRQLDPRLAGAVSHPTFAQAGMDDHAAQGSAAGPGGGDGGGGGGGGGAGIGVVPGFCHQLSPGTFALGRRRYNNPSEFADKDAPAGHRTANMGSCGTELTGAGPFRTASSRQR